MQGSFNTFWQTWVSLGSVDKLDRQTQHLFQSYRYRFKKEPVFGLLHQLNCVYGYYYRIPQTAAKLQ